MPCCEKIAGECIYYSGSYLAGPAITQGDSFDVAISKLTLYAASSSGGGAVSSVFGRTGAVVAQSGDYAAFYPELSSVYNNPSWIGSLAWSKITGKPSITINGLTQDLSADRTWTVGSVTSIGIASSELAVIGGPVTSSGTITLNLNANAVSFNKIQQINSNTLLGRFNVGTGNIEEIQIGTGLTLSGGGVLSSGGGTVTSVGITSSDLSVSGSPITSSGSIAINLNNTGIVAGAYTNPNITVDAKGRVTLISSGSGSGGEANTASNLGGGTGLFASKVGADLQFKSLVAGTNITLTPTGTTVTIAAASAGTVTSVGLVSTDFTISGSPVTTSGFITANLIASGAVAGTYGGSTLIPIVTINSKGIITGISTATPSGGSGSSSFQGNLFS